MVAVLFASAAVVLVILYAQQVQLANNQAAISQSRALAVQSTLNQDTRYDLSLLLSVEAYGSPKPMRRETVCSHACSKTLILIQFLLGHTAQVWSVAFSPDGKTLATGSSDQTIILWDVSDPKTPLQLSRMTKGHTAPVWSVAFSPDGKSLASAARITPSSCGT